MKHGGKQADICNVGQSVHCIKQATPQKEWDKGQMRMLLVVCRKLTFQSAYKSPGTASALSYRMQQSLSLCHACLKNPTCQSHNIERPILDPM